MTEIRSFNIDTCVKIYACLGRSLFSSNFELFGHPNGFPISIELEIGSDEFPDLLLRVENALWSRIVVRGESRPSDSEIGITLVIHYGMRNTGNE